MRKTFLGSTLCIAVVLALSLFGCDSSVDTGGDDTPSVEAPANVKATAYEGVIRVTWDAAKNAVGYDIYRQPVDTSNAQDFGKKVGTVSVTAATQNLIFDDVVSYANELQHDKQYTYTVVAYNGSGNTDTNWKKSSAKASAVKANIPAAGAALAAPANVDVKQFVAINGTAEYVQVTWDATPGRVYSIRYTYGTTSAPPTGQTIGGLLVNNTDPRGFKGSYILPLLSGNTAVQVVASLRTTSTSSTGTNYYYTPGEAAPKEIVGSPKFFQWNSTYNVNFDASRPSGTTTSVLLSWAVDTNNEVVGYEVYRATTEGEGLTSDWTAVNIDNKRIVNISGTDYWRVYDTVEPDKSYQYILIGINAVGAKTAPTMQYTGISYNDGVDKVTLTVPAVTPSVIPATTLTENPYIQLSLTPEAGVAYTIKRAEVTYVDNNGTAVVQSTGAFETFTGSTVPATDVVVAQRIVKDTGVTPRHSYIYEVVATKGAVTSDPYYTTIVNTGAFSPAINISVSATKSGSDTSITITPNSSGYYGKPLVIELWRREVNSSTATKVGSDSDVSASLTTPSAITKTDSAVPAGAYYYSIVVKEAPSVGGRTLVNTGTRTSGSVTF